MTPPLSDELVIRDDGKLYKLCVQRLYHPVCRLRLPKGHPARAEYVRFSIF